MTLIKELFPLLSTCETLKVSCDTRNLERGDVFVCIPCDKALHYAREAAKKGAQALVCDAVTGGLLKEENEKTPIFIVSNPRLALCFLAREMYVDQPETVIAVTGTNGKSSVVGFIRQMWNLLRLRGASLGTLGLTLTDHGCVHDFALPPLTTPDALTMHHLLHTLSLNNINYCAIEASSHGLDQYRIHGVNVKAAGFTNLTQDHLDYHSSMDDYFSAKTRLFTDILNPQGTAVLNANSPYFSALNLLITGRGQQVLAYSITEGTTPVAEKNKDEEYLKASNIGLNGARIKFDLTYKGQNWANICVPVVGLFQIENILCAAGLLMATGIPIDDIIPLLPDLKSAPGRMEFVGETSKGGRVFIDYAHTPDALFRSLTALKAHMIPADSDCDQGKLYLIFGCGGNRDTGKRAIMGEIAAAHADVICVTDDNPRHENPAFIRAQILTGCPTATEIGDRHAAIEHAVNQLRQGDSLLIAGKGHEQGQIIGDRRLPFDDRDVVQKLLVQKVKL